MYHVKIDCSYDKLVDINALVPNPKNNNRHSVEQIQRLSKIIEFQGMRSPIVVSNRSGFIVKGHGRLEALKLLNETQAPVDYQDYENEAQEYADMTADNSIARWAELDLESLNNELKEFPELDVDLLGILDFKIPEIESLDPQTDEDEVPEVIDPITKRGDVWLLGNHRLCCGDSTMIDDVEKLMNGQKADIVFTSPPYNVGRTPNGNDKKYISNDDNKDQSEFRSFLSTYVTNYLQFVDYVFSNMQSLAGNKIALIEHLYDMREVFADTIIWDKKTAEPAMARRVLNSRFEYIHIFSNEAKRTVGKRDFRGTLENVFEMNSRQGKDYAKVHKATFPVQLPEKFISNFVESSVVDPFNGTGTTLIAAENKKVNYFGMEFEPLYCDITIQRWQNYTGKQATLESNGKTYDELKS